MRIVVDLQSCQSGSRFGGIGRYSMSLLKAMITHHPQHEYLVVLNELFPEPSNEVRAELRNYLPPDHILSFPSPAGSASSRNRPELTKSAEIIRESFIANLSPDIVHVSSVVEGVHDDIVTSIGQIESGPPTAATFYDLIPMVQRELYLLDPMTRSHYFRKVRHLARADGLLAISQFVADEGKRLLPDFKGKFANILGGVDPHFRKANTPQKLLPLRRKYGLTKKFILYTASFDQRKNQRGLIEAFALIPADRRQNHQLAFAGGGSNEIYANYTAIATGLGLSEDDVVFLGRVTDDELVTLYNGCDLFAFPSKLEGLGLPVLEAMACGAPVVGSGTSSLIEVLGSEALMFDPDDVLGMSRKIESGLFDREFRRAAIAHGEEHAKRFTWENSAAIAMDALVDINRNFTRRVSINTTSDALLNGARGEELVEGDLMETSIAAIKSDLSHERPWDTEAYRVGWITSWATRCGIAAYSQQLIRHSSFKPVILASYVTEEMGEDEGEGFEVVRCWEQGKTDFLFELATTIEEQELNAVMIQFNYGFFDFEKLSPFILEIIGKGVSVFMTLHSTVDQSDDPSFCLGSLLPALRLCRRLFVHSIHDVRRLAQMGLVENVVLIPIGVPAAELTAEPRDKQAFTIATYGFALPGKGLPELVEAVSLLKNTGENPRLIMVNAHYKDQDGLSTALLESVEQSIEKFELEDSIEMHTGFLRDAESLALISQADAVVFPYTKTGESGSAAVRLGLVSGRIVATTPLPIFDDVKDAVYQFPGQSAQHIAQGLKALQGKMATEDAEITHLRAQAKCLVGATQYSAISRFLDERMKADIYLNCFTESIRLNREKVSLRNAAWVRDRIVSKGSGLICYGPYAPLAPGSYRVMVKGTLRTGQERASLRFGAVDEAFATVDLRPGKDDTLCDFLVVIQKAVPSVELVALQEGTGVLTISDYIVARRWR